MGRVLAHVSEPRGGSERERGETRWPMASGVLVAGVLRAALPPELRLYDPRGGLLALIVVLTVALIIGDPGRIDRDVRWLRVLTAALVGLITLANAGSSIRLVISIIYAEPFTQAQSNSEPKSNSRLALHWTQVARKICREVCRRRKNPGHQRSSAYEESKTRN